MSKNNAENRFSYEHSRNIEIINPVEGIFRDGDHSQEQMKINCDVVTSPYR